jgi:predicted TIM-barrel fold metal-dependent hydrolase
MRIVDVHTHVYPDDLAGEITRSLRHEGLFEACCDGTVEDLRRFMRTDGVARSVNLPVATRKEQVVGINRKMVVFNRSSPGDVVSLGAMHPEFGEVGDVEEEIRYLAWNGVKGIKMHPEYQRFYPDDPSVFPIYEACRLHGLIVHFHAGFDFPDPGHIRATPQRLKAVTKIGGLKIVFAHMGGFRMWEDVLKHLAGTSAYLDTAFVSTMAPADLASIVRAHGADKVLFGSDFPWTRANAIRMLIDRAIEDVSEREKIFHANADRLFDPPVTEMKNLRSSEF